MADSRSAQQKDITDWLIRNKSASSSGTVNQVLVNGIHPSPNIPKSNTKKVSADSTDHFNYSDIDSADADADTFVDERITTTQGIGDFNIPDLEAAIADNLGLSSDLKDDASLAEPSVNLPENVSDGDTDKFVVSNKGTMAPLENIETDARDCEATDIGKNSCVIPIRNEELKCKISLKNLTALAESRNHSRKRSPPRTKQKARKSGVPFKKVLQTELPADIKTVNLYPIANMEIKRPDIESALGLFSRSLKDHDDADLKNDVGCDSKEKIMSENAKSTNSEGSPNRKKRRRRFGQYSFGRKAAKRKLSSLSNLKDEAKVETSDNDGKQESDEGSEVKPNDKEQAELAVPSSSTEDGAPPPKKQCLEDRSNSIEEQLGPRSKRKGRKSFNSCCPIVSSYSPIQKSIEQNTHLSSHSVSGRPQLFAVAGKGQSSQQVTHFISVPPPSGGKNHLIAIPNSSSQTQPLLAVTSKGQSVVIPVVPLSSGATASSNSSTQPTTVLLLSGPSINNNNKILYNHPLLLHNPPRPSSSAPFQPQTCQSRTVMTSLLRAATPTSSKTTCITPLVASTPSSSCAKTMTTMSTLLSSPSTLTSTVQFVKHTSLLPETASFLSPPPLKAMKSCGGSSSPMKPRIQPTKSPNGAILPITPSRNKFLTSTSLAQRMSSPIVTMVKTLPMPPSPQDKIQEKHVKRTSDIDLLPLCACKLRGTKFANVAKVTYCQALDSIDEKVVGCCNKVSSGMLVRPAVKIPFMAFCEEHQVRLKNHQCCPGCGHFCTEGRFYQCSKDNSVVHQFHKQCQIFRNGKFHCPHCGEESQQYEAIIKPNEAKKQLHFQRERAKMTVGLSFNRQLAETGIDNEEKSVTIMGTNKQLTSKGLPLGPTKTEMEQIILHMDAERPKKLRLTAKNLYMVCKNGELDKVIFMLAEGIDPNSQAEEFKNKAPLHAAALCGHLGIAHCLLQAGANPNVEDDDLVTPIMAAAENNKVPVMKLLVKSGAVVEAKGEDGMTCIHLASRNGHKDAITYLISEGLLDVNTLDDGGWTPLVWASEYRRINTVRFLLNQGSNPNIKDNEENIALHWAAYSGSVDIAELFLNSGCDIESMNEHGDRPLHVASRQNHYECVVLLLAKGADVDVVNNENETPLECCPDKDEPVWMALKVNKQLKSFAAKRNVRPEKLLHRDISFGKEKTAMPVVNAADDDDWPRDFMYVTANVETSHLNINHVITSLHNCQCEDDCSSVTCPCSRVSIKCWYDKEGRLASDFNMLEPPMLFECNRSCRCWVNCFNRVVQNGIMARLQIFRTTNRGWGVRTLLDIPQGTFICEYVGELISDSEADRREDDSYLFDLDNKDGETYCIDARKFGNVSRFINHLCEPNLIPVKVFVDHQDLRFPHICFFSSREIKAGEELGFDYGEKFWIIKWKQFTCACGTAKCRYSKDKIQQTLTEYRRRMMEEEADANVDIK